MTPNLTCLTMAALGRKPEKNIPTGCRLLAPDLLDISSAQAEDPVEATAERWDTHLLQDFGPLLTLLQQMFGVTCSFIQNGLSGEEKHFNASFLVRAFHSEASQLTFGTLRSRNKNLVCF